LARRSARRFRRAAGGHERIVDDLEGVARGAETLLDVLARYTDQGWSSQFAPRPGGLVECESCRHASAAVDVPVLELRRLEGASDPDDMLAVVAIECPNCGLRGSLVLNYGPTATEEDASVLLGLGNAPR
jgi:hypothetical protein